MERSAGFPIPTLVIATLHAASGLLGVFFDEKGGMALRARFIHGPVPHREFTLRIIGACVKRASFLCALLRKIAAVLRALDAERDGFGRLAFGIGGAREKFAETARLDHHRRLALFTLLVRGNVLL